MAHCPLEWISLAILHPQELKALLNYKIWYEPLRRLEDDPVASRINSPTMKACWHFLDLTSRSFSAVIKELEGELSRVMCLFYLILRGLDTIEDDMTIHIDEKETLLKSFHLKLSQPGWTFDKSGPDEKDRLLLVEFDKVIEEFQLLGPKYRAIIQGITAKMGGGMARFARVTADNCGIFSVDTLNDFDIYCHYVAGLVGEGLSKLFACSGKEDEDLGDRLTLSNSMGLLLQKTNILRDFKEDVDGGRMFWPKEIWSQFVEHPRELTYPQNHRLAKWALNQMVLDALTHSIDCLEYMTLLKNQSIFNFCAIPQVMAIATLEKCFNNLDVFKKNVKIRRSLTVQLMMKASNPRDFGYIFADFAQRIHARIDSEDPSFLKFSVLVSKIVAWSENRYPSYIITSRPPPLYQGQPGDTNTNDVRLLQQPDILKKIDGRTSGAGGVAASHRHEPARMGKDDVKLVLVVSSILLGLVVSLSCLIGFIVFWATRGGDVQPIRLNVPLTSWRIEL